MASESKKKPRRVCVGVFELAQLGECHQTGVHNGFPGFLGQRLASIHVLALAILGNLAGGERHEQTAAQSDD